MNASPMVNELAAALSHAQAMMESAKKGSVNPHFHSKYADLANIVEAIRQPFAAHGLSYVQLPQPTGPEEVAVETVLLHASGQWISSVFAIPVSKPDAHGRMSALTYCRRGALAAMAGIAPDDDDGNAASGADAPKRPARAAAPETPDEDDAPAPRRTTPDQESPACPACGQHTLRPSKYERGGWYCSKPHGGCGKAFKALPAVATTDDEIPF